MSHSLSPGFFRRVSGKISMLLLATMMQPLAVMADSADEVRSEILNSSAYARENLKDMEGTISSKGALQFWSSGGLIQNVPGNAPPATYEAFTLTPKHIEVVTLVEGKAAVAMYYSEGAYDQVGSEAVPHYMTRITEVYVKEDGKWKVRAAHYSPIAAGSGTRQSAID